MSEQIRTALALLGAVALVSLGCASNVERYYGTAYATNVARQIANPDAGSEDTGGTLGTDGRSGAQAVDNYRKRAEYRGAQPILPTLITDLSSASR